MARVTFDLLASSSTTMRNSYPDTNYFESEALWVGCWNNAEDPIFTSFIYFPLSNLPRNSIIHTATLWLYCTSGPASGAAVGSIRIHRCLRIGADATEMTWDNYATGDSWDDGGGTGNEDMAEDYLASISNQDVETGEWYSFALDVAVLNSMFKEGSGGFILYCTNDYQGSGVTFGTHGDTGEEPTLTLEYSRPPRGILTVM